MCPFQIFRHRPASISCPGERYALDIVIPDGGTVINSIGGIASNSVCNIVQGQELLRGQCVGFVLGSLSCFIQRRGFDPPLRFFPVEGIFPLELT